MALALRDPAIGRALACFVARLRTVDVAGGPTPGAHNFGRGTSLATRDERTRAAIAVLAGDIEADTATAVWEQGLAADPSATPGWVHSDLRPGNLILSDGRLVGRSSTSPASPWVIRRAT
jgi:aminoglycoside phosphotransferase (APT) family kinase protein